jgi:hypothetical protein
MSEYQWLAITRTIFTVGLLLAFMINTESQRQKDVVMVLLAVFTALYLVASLVESVW